MRKNQIFFVIKMVGLFLIITFAFDKIVYFSLSTISDDVYSGQSVGKVNQYLEIKDTIKVLVLGSSRANHIIDSRLLNKNSFNMGMDGTKIAFSAILAKTIKKDNKQLILFHIDPKNAFGSNYKINDVLNLKNKFHQNEVIRKEISRWDKVTFLQDFYWCLDYNGKVLGLLKNYFSPKYNSKNYYGFDPLQVTSVQRGIFKNVLKENTLSNCPDNLEVNYVYKKYLDELKLEFDTSSTKKLVFYTSPIYNDPCSKDNEKLAEIMKSNGLKYFDFSNYFGEKSSLDLWRDHTHLSSKGAKEFTLKLKEILNKDYKDYLD